MPGKGITILGLGPGRLDLLTLQAWRLLEDAQEIYLRTRQHPLVADLPPGLIVGIQILFSITLAPLFNTLFALGEELGWRGYLLPKLFPLGQGRAILLSGVIWGVWHWPAILQGHNYPNQPILGMFLMIGFCVLFGAILSWLYLRTGSPWAPALGHASLNAFAGFPLVFMPGVNMALGGTLTSLVGWIPMILFVGWLIWKRDLLGKALVQVSRETN